MNMDMILKRERKNWFYSYNMIFDLSISIHAKIVYLYLCRCADSDGQSFPSHKTIAEKCSMGVTKVKQAINELIKEGLLYKENRVRDKDGGQSSNLYIIFDTPQTQNNGTYQSNESYPQNCPQNNPQNDPPSHEMTTPQSYDDYPPSHVVTTPQSRDDYKGLPNIRTTQKEGLSIYYEEQQEIFGFYGLNLHDGQASCRNELQEILEDCDLELIEEPFKTLVVDVVIDLYYNKAFSKRTGIPHEVVKARLKRLSIYIIQNAIDKYKEKSDDIIIAPTNYFEHCLWTSLTDHQLEMARIYT